MFGDWGWIDDRTNEQELRLENWLKGLNKSRLVIVELGAGRAVPTVRYKSESIFRNLNCNFIRINPRDFEGPNGTISIKAGAMEGLEEIFSNI